MPKPTEARPDGARFRFLPVQTRVPLRFGPETLTSVTCDPVCLQARQAERREK